MKTKPFLLATAGSTVDGRTIDEKLLKEMASSYDPKTYGARLNIEHVRGITGDKPFRSYGDVLELSTAEVDVNFNGKAEKRLGLFGVFDVTDDAKALNDAGQKVYPSIEIEDNFAGKGFAYLMGCALTDSPASIATQRLQFNRQMPGTIHLARDDSALLEFVDEGGQAAQEGLLASMKSMFDGFAAKFAPKEEQKPKVEPEAEKPAGFNVAEFAPMFEQVGQIFAKEIAALRTELRTEVDGLAVQFSRLESERERQPAQSYTQRPRSDGNAGNYAGIF
jgi:Phage capsid scaffolding protein (GPO) serine peptidase.